MVASFYLLMMVLLPYAHLLVEHHESHHPDTCGLCQLLVTPVNTSETDVVIDESLTIHRVAEAIIQIPDTQIPPTQQARAPPFATA